jgi:ATP-binding cassette subfamily B protein
MFNKIASNIEEILSNIRLVYSFGQKKNILELVDKENSLYLDYYKERTKLRSLFFSSSIMGVFLSIIVVIWIGTINIAEGNMTRGVLVAFLFYSVTVSLSLSGIFEVVSDFQKYLIAAEQVFEIIDSKEIESNNGTILDIGQHIEKISFNHINFSYPTRPNNKILRDLNFEIKSGEIIGIVGKSGFGKSTIMQLLLKFYNIDEGSILINGKNINDIETNYLRSLISITAQESYIFSSTIFDNIKFARPDATNEEINDIAKLSLINEFTDKFKDGLMTSIGSKGVQISGGQRQRIAIARSLLKKPEILILDEATNALDTSLEQEIFKNIKSLMRDKIIIMIGHRSKIMELATKIFVVDENGIVASGTHEELIKNSNLYQKLSMEKF